MRVGAVLAEAAHALGFEVLALLRFEVVVGYVEHLVLDVYGQRGDLQK